MDLILVELVLHILNWTHIYWTGLTEIELSFSGDANNDFSLDISQLSTTMGISNTSQPMVSGSLENCTDSRTTDFVIPVVCQCNAYQAHRCWSDTQIKNNWQETFKINALTMGYTVNLQQITVNSQQITVIL